MVRLPEPRPSVSVDENMRIARRAARFRGHLFYIWFYQHVRNGGPWDFKQKNRDYENFGSFHYGATGHAGGVPEAILLRAAGCAQYFGGNTEPNWGNCLRHAPYGDDPKGQEWIREGIKYAKQKGY